MARAAEPAQRVSFTAQQRHCIDDNALWGSRERLNTAKIEASGSVLEWLVVHTPLPTEEERRRAEQEHKDSLVKFKIVELPAAAQEIYDDLLAALPVRMQLPKELAGLVVIEEAKQNALIVGLAQIYVDQGWLASVLADEQSGRDQLAFVLAHELGHASLGHTRRRLQRTWLEEELRKDVERKEQAPGERERTLRILDNLKGVGTILEHVYTREEAYQADLFALHLCRNAGYDVENCLDALRGAAVVYDAKLLDEPAARVGTPPVEPEEVPQTGPEAVTLAEAPLAAHRLRRLRLELDGLIYGDAFGLFEFDRETKSLKRAADASVPNDTRAVVCIHGMESSGAVYLPLLTHMADDEAAAKVRLFAFQYPADDSLARSGKSLQRELQRVFASAKQIAFVCHSAGGLVFRYYAEVEGGDFQRAIFLGTPHHGSDLAQLRRLLEVVQFVGDIKLGYDVALQTAILDGRGQITFDLEPDSLFLQYLNRPHENLHRERYAIYRGKALSRTRTLLLQAAVEATRASLARKFDKDNDSTLAKFGVSAMEVLVLPHEIVDGDLCVRCESALLDGVEAVETIALMHTALPRDPDVISEVVERLKTAP